MADIVVLGAGVSEHTAALQLKPWPTRNLSR